MTIKRFTSMFLGMNSVFISKNGKEGILIDPGVFPPEIDKINHYLERHHFNAKAVLFTHTHGDHISGWHAFSQLESYAHEIVKTKSGTERNNDVAFIQDLYSRSNFDYSHVAFPRISHFVREKEVTRILDFDVVFSSVPGHSKDSTVIIFPEFNFMMSGDMLIKTSIPFMLNSVVEYEHSLEKVEELVDYYDIRQLGPGHAQFAHSREDIEERIHSEQDYVTRLLKIAKNSRYSPENSGEIESELMEGIRFPGKIPYQHKTNVKKLMEELPEILNEGRRA